MIDLSRLGPEAQKQIIRKLGTQKRPAKYRNEKTRRGELTFDSKAEAERYIQQEIVLDEMKVRWSKEFHENRPD